jgi:hypothetical protein
MSDKAQEALHEGFRALQQLLAQPGDGLALHNLTKHFSQAIKLRPSCVREVAPSLESCGRKLGALAMWAQALISEKDAEKRCEYGLESLARMKKLYGAGYASDKEDVGFWKHYILHADKQLALVLDAYTALLQQPESVSEDETADGATRAASYTRRLMVDMRDFYEARHLPQLKTLENVLKKGGPTMQAKAEVLMSDLEVLKRHLS